MLRTENRVIGMKESLEKALKQQEKLQELKQNQQEIIEIAKKILAGKDDTASTMIKDTKEISLIFSDTSTNRGYSSNERKVLTSVLREDLFKDLAPKERSIQSLMLQGAGDLPFEQKRKVLAKLITDIAQVDVDVRMQTAKEFNEAEILRLSAELDRNQTEKTIDIKELEKCFHKDSKFKKLEESRKQELGGHYNKATEKVGALLKILGNGKFDPLTSKDFLPKVIKATKEVADNHEYLELDEINSVLKKSIKRNLVTKDNFDIDDFMSEIKKIAHTRIEQEYLNKSRNITQSSNAVPSASLIKSEKDRGEKNEIVHKAPPLLSRIKRFTAEEKAKLISLKEAPSHTASTKRSQSISEKSKSRKGSFTESTSKGSSDREI